MTAKDKESDLNSVILNDDCLLHVFGYFEIRDKFHLARVSKQFQKLIYHKEWYFRVNNQIVPKIVNKYNLVDIELFTSLCQKYRNIIRIEISDVLVNDTCHMSYVMSYVMSCYVMSCYVMSYDILKIPCHSPTIIFWFFWLSGFLVFKSRPTTEHILSVDR